MTDPSQLTTDPAQTYQLRRIADQLEEVNRNLRRIGANLSVLQNEI